jgi:hypothetical protein
MLKRLAILSALTVGSATAAFASPITGTISADGTDFFTATTISFTNPGTIFGGSGANTGSFSVLTNGNAVTFFPTLSGNLPYFTGSQTVPPPLSPLEVATTAEAGETFDFFMTSYNAAYGTTLPGCSGGATCLVVTGLGYWTESGGPNLSSSPGSFTFSSSEYAGQTSTTFQASSIATPAATPEPASLALVGTGLFGIAAFARRKLFV